MRGQKCAHAGSFSRQRSAWWWALLWFICCCFVLLIAAPRSSANEQSRLIESLRMRLQTISAAATSLQEESETWKQLSAENEQRVNELLSELAELRLELETWQAASADSQKQVAELKASLEQSEAKLTQVSQTLRVSADSWKQAADAATLSARRARRRGLIMAVLAALAGGAVGYVIGK